MRLENIVWDARDPLLLGRFWSAALGARVSTEQPDFVESRIDLGAGAFLDLCFPQVTDPSDAPPRLHLDLRGGAHRAEIVDRLCALGATPADIGQGDVPWTVLADPQGETFCVMPDRPAYAGTTGPIAALPLDSADPARDAAFWAAATGWHADGPTLRHPSGVGPLLELCAEPEPARGKNRLHLDVRPEVGDGGVAAVAERLVALGARPLTAPGEFHWQSFDDPSGNAFCVLAGPEDR